MSHFVLDRPADGVLVVRTHRDGGPALWSRDLLHGWNALLTQIGTDIDAEVLILTGTGGHWLAGVDPASFATPIRDWGADAVAEQYHDGVRLLERLVMDIAVPTIAAVNGPGPRLELALLCDLTLCTPGTVFGDGNFTAGSVPGDGMHLALTELIGAKRANHVVYTGATIPAAEAQRLGLVNEVVPDDDLLPRALEIAARIMTAPRHARRLTHHLAVRGWQRRVVADLRGAYAHQLFAATA